MFLGRQRHALVTTAENRDLSAAIAEGARKLLDHGSLARPADGQVSDADYQTAECALSKNAVPVKKEPEQNRSLVTKRHEVKKSAQDSGARALAPTENDVDRELLEVF